MRPQFCILRTQKIKSRNDFISSVRHHYRIGGLENCNPNLTEKNINAWSSDECISKFQSFFNEGGKFEKRRKDAVLGIEYLITASPDFFKNKSREDVMNYLKDASNFLKAKHGKENVLLETWEFDETSPHISMIVVPVKNGKLNAKGFLGGSAQLRKLQTDFHLLVAEKYGLERGIGKTNKRANHKTLKEFYHDLNVLKERICNDEFGIQELSDDEKIKLIYEQANRVDDLLVENFELAEDNKKLTKSLHTLNEVVCDFLNDKVELDVLQDVVRETNFGLWKNVKNYGI